MHTRAQVRREQGSQGGTTDREGQGGSVARSQGPQEQTRDSAADGVLKEDERRPPHQPEQAEGTSTTNNNNNWMYPSEQQFFHALRRKGWDHVEVESVPTIVQIHNTINEKTWKLVQEWEQTQDITLVQFHGRPKDISPLAVWKHYIMRLTPDPPFDRHDWYIETKSATTTTTPRSPCRYIIDYYMLPNPLQDVHPDAPSKTMVDVRFALDSPQAAWKRIQRLVLEEWIPYLWREWQSQRVLQPTQKIPKYYNGVEPTSRNVLP